MTNKEALMKDRLQRFQVEIEFLRKQYIKAFDDVELDIAKNLRDCIVLLKKIEIDIQARDSDKVVDDEIAEIIERIKGREKE